MPRSWRRGRLLLLLVTTHGSSALLPVATVGSPRFGARLAHRSALHNLRGGFGGWFSGESAPSVDLERARARVSTVELDQAIDRAVSLTTDKEVILQWNRSPIWLFRQFRGTVIETVWKSCLVSMAVGAALIGVLHYGLLGIPKATWPIFTTPVATHPVITRLLCLNVVWEYVVGLATFILTFFLAQSYSYWRAQLGLVRGLQGRIHDIGLLASTFAARDEEGNYTPAARRLLEDTARNVRLLHILYWAGLDDSLHSLTTAEGLSRLMQRGVLNEREEQTLVASGARSTKRHEVILQWILLRLTSSGGGSEGKIGNGAMTGGGGFEGSLCDTCKQLRAACGTVPDQMVERMPLAYVHIVHVMIDLLLVLAPAALYPKVGTLVIPLLGFLTLFYRGLLFLAMSFLDPFGNEGSKAQNIDSDVLITEINRASTGWWRGGETMPFDRPRRAPSPAAEHA